MSAYWWPVAVAPVNLRAGQTAHLDGIAMTLAEDVEVGTFLSLTAEGTLGRTPAQPYDPAKVFQLDVDQQRLSINLEMRADDTRERMRCGSCGHTGTHGDLDGLREGRGDWCSHFDCDTPVTARDWITGTDCPCQELT